LIELREIIPPSVEFDTAFEVLEQAICERAPQHQALDLIVAFISSLGRTSTDNTGAHAAGLLAVLVGDVPLDDEQPPISGPVLASAIVHLMRTTIFLPAPAELLRACLEKRGRAIRARNDLCEAADEVLQLRERVDADLADADLAGLPFDDGMDNWPPP
jgi:hypothetical protein